MANRKWRDIAPYALMGLVAFALVVFILRMLLMYAERLVFLGLVSHVYYVLLIPLAFFSALGLFAILRSSARYRGEQLGGSLEIGGPAVVFFLVIILSHWLIPNATNFSFTVFVHGTRGKQDLCLRGKGSVILTLGGLSQKAPIGKNGEAYFIEVPANFRGQKVPVIIDADGFEMTDGGTVTLANASDYVTVRRKDTVIKGYVKDEAGKIVVGAEVAVGNISASSTKTGYFELLIPGASLPPDEVSLEVTAPSYNVWRDSVITNSNDITVILHPRT
jgi:hypothetical protein